MYCMYIVHSFLRTAFQSSYPVMIQLREPKFCFTFIISFLNLSKLNNLPGLSVVNDFADTVSPYSRTMSTRCPHIQQLRRHIVRVVNDFAIAYIVSALSTASRTMCQCSQRLSKHSVSIVNNYINTVKE